MRARCRVIPTDRVDSTAGSLHLTLGPLLAALRETKADRRGVDYPSAQPVSYICLDSVRFVGISTLHQASFQQTFLCHLRLISTQRNGTLGVLKSHQHSHDLRLGIFCRQCYGNTPYYP